MSFCPPTLTLPRGGGGKQITATRYHTPCPGRGLWPRAGVPGPGNPCDPARNGVQGEGRGGGSEVHSMTVGPPDERFSPTTFQASCPPSGTGRTLLPGDGRYNT